MRTEPVRMVSDGLALCGAFFRPDGDDGKDKKPLIIVMSGFTGLYTIHPSRFARFLTKRGHRCFSFDYRGFANSEGARGDLILEDQVRDVRNAISFVRTFPFVDHDKIVLVGWAMGAGVVLKAAYRSLGIAALCALNGFFDGYRFLHFHRGDHGMDSFEMRVERARQVAATTGTWLRAEAFDIYPLDPGSSTYVDKHLRTYENYFEHDFSLAFADSLLSWKPEAIAPFMSVPIWIAHGENNQLHSPEESKSLYSLYGGEKQLYWIRNAGHTEWLLDENPIFQKLASDMETWLSSIFAGAEMTI